MSMTRTGWAWPLSLAWLAACGPDVSTDTGGAGGATTSTTNGGGGADPCETDEGYRICGGIHDCAKTGECETCTLIVAEAQGLDHETAICFGSIPVGYLTSASACIDGGLLLPEYEYCVPAEVGPLFCDSGEGDILSFTDLQTYDCTPLPEPTVCPETEVLELCGDACGTCADPEANCSGRSPRHPYSFCSVGSLGRCGTDAPCDKAGQGCLIYVHEDDPEAQALADSRGRCIDIATCLAAAAELPGGAECLE